MLIVFIRSILLYALIIFSIRLMGKRQLGELQPSELVVTILVSNIATLPIEDINIPMAMGVIPILTLVSLDVLMSYASLKSRRLRRVISGSPKIIISDGVIDQRQLRELRFTVDDLTASLRELDIFDISEVQFAIVETTGKISAFQRSDERACTAGMMKRAEKNKNPPMLVIDGGHIIKPALKKIGKNAEWLEKVLCDNSVSSENVFILTADTDGDYTLVKKLVGKSE